MSHGIQHENVGRDWCHHICIPGPVIMIDRDSSTGWPGRGVDRLWYWDWRCRRWWLRIQVDGSPFRRLQPRLLIALLPLLSLLLYSKPVTHPPPAPSTSLRRQIPGVRGRASHRVCNGQGDLCGKVDGPEDGKEYIHGRPQPPQMVLGPKVAGGPSRLPPIWFPMETPVKYCEGNNCVE